MPVGTAGTVKAMFTDHVKSSGADILLGNTYHLMLRPGAERVARLGGLHKFMNWDGPILTDSGGFQVMSLSKLRKMSEEGVTFRSHIDGSNMTCPPERSIEIQCLLGADIQMQLGRVCRVSCNVRAGGDAMELSLRWAERSKAAFTELQILNRLCSALCRAGYTLSYAKDRRTSHPVGFPGYSIGGLALERGTKACLRHWISPRPGSPPANHAT